MKTYLITILLLLSIYYSSIAQIVVPSGFERNEEGSFFSISNTQIIKSYKDSLSSIYKNELLTAFVYSTLHELVPSSPIEYSINGLETIIIPTDSFGRFFITGTSKIESVHIKVEMTDYYKYDSVFIINTKETPTLFIELKPKYKILLRGRIYAGNMPIEGVDVAIKHKSDLFNISTLGCYTDDESYWNCLYLGMFKHAVVFENPDDTLTITYNKEGFCEQVTTMTMSEYNGTIMPLRLKYAHDLVKYPKHNIGISFGHTFQNTWSVGINYIYQMQIGSFKRLGIGVDGAMLMNIITSQHASFENMPPAKAETYYPVGMLGPLLNLSITKPTNRLFNIYIGTVAPYLFTQERIAIHPYVAGKFYLDLNKAMFWQVKYIDYTINETEYEFNSYGSAYETKLNNNYQKVLFSLGLLVSF